MAGRPVKTRDRRLAECGKALGTASRLADAIAFLTLIAAAVADGPWQATCAAVKIAKE